MKIPTSIDAQGWLALVVPAVREHQREFGEAAKNGDVEAVRTGSLLALDYVNALVRSGYVLRGEALDQYETIRYAHKTFVEVMEHLRQSSSSEMKPEQSVEVVTLWLQQTMAMYRLLKLLDEESVTLPHGDVSSPALFGADEPGALPSNEMVVRVVLDDDTKRWLEQFVTGVLSQTMMLVQRK